MICYRRCLSLYLNVCTWLFCRESRRSPTYEAYRRSRRLAVVTVCEVIFFLLHEDGILVVTHLSVLVFIRSRSRSYSPSYARRHSRGGYSDEAHRSRPRTPKIEYITEFGGSGDRDTPKLEGYSPPASPSQADVLSRSEHWTFYSCKDRFNSLYSAAAYPRFVAWDNLSDLE